MDIGWITNYLSQDMYINIPMIIAQKSKRLTIGRGILFNADSEEVLNYINNFYQNGRVYIKLLKMAEMLSLYGRAQIILWKSLEGKLQLEIASPLMMSWTGKVSEQEQLAEAYIMPEQSMNATFWRVQMRPKYTTIEMYKSREMIVNGTIADMAKDLTPEKSYTYPNNIGILPIVEIINIPKALVYGNSNILQAYPDCYSVYNLIDDVQENISKKRIQRRMVQPRAYGSFSAEKLKELRLDPNPNISEIADVFINVAANGYNNQAGSNGFEIVAADPHFSEYVVDKDDTLKMIWNGAGYDYDSFNGVNYTNKTESMMNNKLDIETTAIKRQVIKLQLGRLFDYVVIDKFPELWDAETQTWKAGQAPYSWDFMDADIVNELTKIDYWEKRLNMGVASRKRIVSELDKVNILVAEQEIKDIDDEFMESSEVFNIKNGNVDNNKDNGIDNKGNTQGVDE